MNREKVKRFIRGYISGERGVFLFDPKGFRKSDPTLTKQIHKLSDEELHQYAILASKIRKNISE